MVRALPQCISVILMLSAVVTEGLVSKSAERADYQHSQKKPASIDGGCQWNECDDSSAAFSLMQGDAQYTNDVQPESVHAFQADVAMFDVAAHSAAVTLMLLESSEYKRASGFLCNPGAIP